MKRATICTVVTLVGLHTGWGAPSVSMAGVGNAIQSEGLVVLGQSPANGRAGLTARDVDRLLTQARSAIRDGQLDQAEKWIVQAEQSGVTYTLFHVGDTPQKARRALEKARNAASGTRQQSSTSRTNPFALGHNQDKIATNDPFASRDPNVASASVPASVGLPSSDPNVDSIPASKMPDGMDRDPSGIDRLLEPSAADREKLGASATKLRGARLALAVGDVRRAAAFVAEAKQLGLHYGLGDDSPAKVEAAIAKYQQVQKNQAALDSSPAWQRHYAQILHEQAEALLAWKEYDEAERLAVDAQRFLGQPEPFGIQPQVLIKRIAAAREANSKNRPEGPSTQTPATALRSDQDTKRKVQILLAQAREALLHGKLDVAEQYATQASGLNVPESAFGAEEDRPSAVVLAIHVARMQAASNTASPASNHVSGIYRPETDPTRTIPAVNGSTDLGNVGTGREIPAPLRTPTEPAPLLNPHANGGFSKDARELLTAGEEALRNQNINGALDYFRQAYEYRDQLDPAALQRLQGHLQLLSTGTAELPTPVGTSLIDAASEQEKVAIRQLSADLTKQQSDARQLRETNPSQALHMLKQSRRTIETASINEAARIQLLRRVDLSIADTETYIEQNRAQLELDAKNRDILEEIDRDRRMKVELQEKIKQLVDEFNQLQKEQKYDEMEVVARRLHELAPDDQTVNQIWLTAKNKMADVRNQRFMDEKAIAFDRALFASEKASMMMDPDEPYQYTDAHSWDQLTRMRRSRFGKRERHMTERELEIKQRLKMPVQLRYTDRPLSEVIHGLGELAGINIHLDPLGLTQEGVRSDTSVTIELRNEITLASALRILLEPLHLSYVIKDEVLKITSEGLRDGEIYTEVYNVADLVIPIPNFTPSGNVGLQGLINDAHAAMGYGNFAAPGPLAVAVNDPRHPQGNATPANSAVLAQQTGGITGTGFSGPMAPIGGGPGGLGGASQADFDSLIDLIVSTISADSWDEVGGPGSIRPFETNLSLVVSQTQEVHEEIADLLDQLRRLQDLQVTIEVRFITLSDRFFERIGVDFDFNVEDGPAILSQMSVPSTPGQAIEGRHPSATVGLQLPAGDRAFPNFTADLDIPFRNDSFGLSVAPEFGSPVDVATFGFAILSDIEAYFLISAAQGDRRSNVLEAPKVTLFNGQQATVSDTVQRPFVISVIPVVGDFAAAQQPVIVVLSEGTFMSIQAVVSDDRRYVRLTVVPFFSQIGDVEEFTFEGSETSASGSSSRDDDDDENAEEHSEESLVRRSGTTVQLPTFQFVSVSTTVSVPDGGTVLLGGIKRLEEGRNEFGVPLLSKVPYINRLFKNVGIARSTTSLMMMVTPRIIIQEEEEARLSSVNE
ncbi:MAG: general secretion pathway protein GspD [Pirellulales bacterium]|nr:general secretion pathway protein GspD [Pirellulales bacterium]